jgi:hypothetical protein
MKRLIVFAILSLFAAIVLAGCHAATNHDIKPVSSAVAADVVERGVS